MVLGAVTSDLYFTSAYFAIRAPRVPGTTTRGPIRLHKALAWVHGPGMILTPILGALAYDQKSSREKLHGIASAHGPVAAITAAALELRCCRCPSSFSQMMKKFIIPVVALLLSGIAFADGQWILDLCTLTYHVSHPLHQTDGVSHAARGKAVCHAGECDFLIAVPVKSFDTGDSNRDLHMIQVTRGAEFPMVTVRTHLPESASTASTLNADLEIQFAGQTARYKQVPFQLTRRESKRALQAPSRPRWPTSKSIPPVC